MSSDFFGSKMTFFDFEHAKNARSRKMNTLKKHNQKFELVKNQGFWFLNTRNIKVRARTPSFGTSKILRAHAEYYFGNQPNRAPRFLYKSQTKISHFQKKKFSTPPLFLGSTQFCAKSCNRFFSKNASACEIFQNLYSPPKFYIFVKFHYPVDFANALF